MRKLILVAVVALILEACSSTTKPLPVPPECPRPPVAPADLMAPPPGLRRLG